MLERGEPKDLRNYMLQDQRQYVIDKFKKPLMKTLIILANRLPEPTKQNTNHQNTDVLIDVWDKFLEMEDNPGRLPLFKAARKVDICEPCHDPYYRDRKQVYFELWLDEVLAGNWKPRPPSYPMDCWKADSDVRGPGFAFLKKCFESPEFREQLKEILC